MRRLQEGQRCQVWVHDTRSGECQLVHETAARLLEAPNWTLQGDALILNGDGRLWRLPLSAPELAEIALEGVPPLNNDHVLDPDGKHVFISACDDWRIYRAPLTGGRAERVSGAEGPDALMHFLHGVSPDGQRLAFVGVQNRIDEAGARVRSAEIFVIGADGRGLQQLTAAGAPTDGPEFSPDGAWIYFNTEQFSGAAQIARMRADGSDVSRLTYSQTVDWFPHLAPDGRQAVYLAYPPGTEGHPADRWVELMLVQDDRWSAPRRLVRLFGGQGTINVNSWSPDSTRFAYVAYPMA